MSVPFFLSVTQPKGSFHPGSGHWVKLHHEWSLQQRDPWDDPAHTNTHLNSITFDSYVLPLHIWENEKKKNMVQSQYNARTLISTETVPCLWKYILLLTFKHLTHSCIHWTDTKLPEVLQNSLYYVIQWDQRDLCILMTLPCGDLWKQSSNTSILHIVLMNWICL